jgi:hypothetical protein
LSLDDFVSTNFIYDPWLRILKNRLTGRQRPLPVQSVAEDGGEADQPAITAARGPAVRGQAVRAQRPIITHHEEKAVASEAEEGVQHEEEEEGHQPVFKSFPIASEPPRHRPAVPDRSVEQTQEVPR